jgi:hypothetical protein
MFLEGRVSHKLARIATRHSSSLSSLRSIGRTWKHAGAATQAMPSKIIHPCTAGDTPSSVQYAQIAFSRSAALARDQPLPSCDSTCSLPLCVATAAVSPTHDGGVCRYLRNQNPPQPSTRTGSAGSAHPICDYYYYYYSNAGNHGSSAHSDPPPSLLCLLAVQESYPATAAVHTCVCRCEAHRCFGCCRPRHHRPRAPSRRLR